MHAHKWPLHDQTYARPQTIRNASLLIVEHLRLLNILYMLLKGLPSWQVDHQGALLLRLQQWVYFISKA